MIHFDADAEIDLKKFKVEDVRFIKIPLVDPFALFKEYKPDSEEYILITCSDGWVLVALPKD